MTRTHHWIRAALVVGQTALALVLLFGSGLLARSYWQLLNVDPGYETEDIFTFQIAPEGDYLPDGEAYARFALDFMDRLRGLPGVQTVGLVENVPLDEGTASDRFLTRAMEADPDSAALVRYTFAAGDYFETMGVSVLAGRPFARDDQLSGHGNVVISRSAARLLWDGEDAVGKAFRRRNSESWSTVVGVVEDVMQNDFREEPHPLVYYPLIAPDSPRSSLSSPAYVVKTPRAEAIAPEIRALAKRVAPEAPMYRAYTMEWLAERSMLGLSFTMLTLAVAAALALVLGAVGLYGVLSYVVTERTREIGVRMALGARAAQVRRMVVGQGLRVVGIGVLLGTLAAAALSRTLESLLFGVADRDPLTFAGTAAVMVLIGALASYLPARQASSVDPIESLRGE